MKKILPVMAAFAIVGAAALTPANAQGVDVRVGPVGAGVGVGHYGHHHGYRHNYGYASDCRVIRQRTETPSGRVIVRTRRVCG